MKYAKIVIFSQMIHVFVFYLILLCKRFRFLFSFSKLSFRILRLNAKYLDAKLMKVRVNSDSWEFKWLSAPAMHSKLCLVKRLLLYLHLTSAISIYIFSNKPLDETVALKPNAYISTKVKSTSKGSWAWFH